MIILLADYLRRGRRMARLNIEDDVFLKAGYLAKEMRWDKRKTLGTLILMWYNSQKMEVVDVTEDELFFITEFKSRRNFAKFCETCAKPALNFLKRSQNSDKTLRNFDETSTKLNETRWRICGNEKHIEAIKSYRDRGKLGGRPTKEKPTGLKSENPLHTNTIQFNSIHKTNPAPSPKSAGTPFDNSLAKAWHSWAKDFLGDNGRAKKLNFDGYVNGLRLMREQDGLSESQIQAVFDFIKQDDFWGQNCLSPSQMRRKKTGDEFSKLDRVLIKVADKIPLSEEEQIAKAKEWAKRMDEQDASKRSNGG